MKLVPDLKLEKRPVIKDYKPYELGIELIAELGDVEIMKPG